MSSIARRRGMCSRILRRAGTWRETPAFSTPERSVPCVEAGPVPPPWRHGRQIRGRDLDRVRLPGQSGASLLNGTFPPAARREGASRSTELAFVNRCRHPPALAAGRPANVVFDVSRKFRARRDHCSYGICARFICALLIRCGV